MELKLNLDPEQINKMVSEAVLASTIGTTIKQVVEEKIRDLNGYDSPLKKAIGQSILAEIAKIIDKAHGEALRTAIRSQMTDEVVTKISTAAWNAFYERLDRGR